MARINTPFLLWKIKSLGERSQRRSAPVTKFSQPRAWISLKRASAAPQSKKLCCVILFFILIIFRSIIQFLVVLFPLLLWLHQQKYCKYDFYLTFCIDKALKIWMKVIEAFDLLWQWFWIFSYKGMNFP